MISLQAVVQTVSGVVSDMVLVSWNGQRWVMILNEEQQGSCSPRTPYSTQHPPLQCSGAWALGLALLVPIWLTLNKLLNHSMPQSLHLQNENVI